MNLSLPKLTLLGLAVVLGACGPASAPAAAETTSSGGDEPANAPPGDEAAELPGVTYGANALLNVYVQGPSPVPGEALEQSVPDDYHMRIIITNTGDAPASVALAHIEFRVLRGDEPIACEGADLSAMLEGPATLEPGEAYEYEATLHCPLSEPGEYTVQAYMSFEGETQVLDLERHYVGEYIIEVPEGSAS